MSGWHVVELPLKRRALPRPGQVDLWLTDLEELPLEAGLNALTRKERVLKQRVQQRFVLRLLLGSYFGVPGKDIVVKRDQFEKPHLGGTLSETGLRFNLSHSGHWLAIALTRNRDIGVDIEQQRPMARAADLASRYFKGPDRARIQQLEEPERSVSFLTQWTAREALIKAMGCSLASHLSQIELDCEPTRIHALPKDWPPDWQLLKPEWPSSVVGHLAIPSAATERELELNCYWLQTMRRS